MSEQRTPPQGPVSDLYDIVNGLVADQGGHFVDTHTRFNLSQEGSLDVVVIEPETGQRERLIVAREVEAAGRRHDQLHAAGIPQFNRQLHGRGVVMYRVPQHVKPLRHERFFVDRPSSSTYVSDREIFEQLGKLWGQIYETTGELPEAPLALTAIQNFEEVNNLLVPIPPYTAWQLGGAENPLELFNHRVAEELRFSNPSVPHDGLLDAVTKGWQHDRPGQ